VLHLLNQKVFGAVTPAQVSRWILEFWRNVPYSPSIINMAA